MKSLSVLLLAIVSLACTTVANAQKIRFIDPTNIWTMIYSSEDVNPHGYSDKKMTFSFLGNKSTGGYTYYQLGIYGMQSYNTILVREDGYGKVLFRYDNDTFEQAFFDYNANVGDTMTWNIKNSYTGNYSVETHIITSIDSIQINGVWHTQFYEGNKSLLYGEGIGSPNPLFHAPAWYMAFSGGFPNYKGFKCFQTNHILPAFSQNVYNLDCPYAFSLSVQNVADDNKNLKVYPQPAYSFVNINLPHETTGSITILNSVGQIAYKEDFKQKSKLLINRNEQVKSGMHFYHILDNKTGISYTGKVLFE